MKTYRYKLEEGGGISSVKHSLDSVSLLLTNLPVIGLKGSFAAASAFSLLRSIGAGPYCYCAGFYACAIYFSLI